MSRCHTVTLTQPLLQAAFDGSHEVPTHRVFHHSHISLSCCSSPQSRTALWCCPRELTALPPLLCCMPITGSSRGRRRWRTMTVSTSPAPSRACTYSGEHPCHPNPSIYPCFWNTCMKHIPRSRYDDEPWIKRLNDWTAMAIRGGDFPLAIPSSPPHFAHISLTFLSFSLSHTGHKVVGISFGHQMVVQALGGKVERNPNGSSVSVMGTKLTPQAQHCTPASNLPLFRRGCFESLF